MFHTFGASPKTRERILAFSMKYSRRLAFFLRRNIKTEWRSFSDVINIRRGRKRSVDGTPGVFLGTSGAPSSCTSPHIYCNYLKQSSFGDCPHVLAKLQTPLQYTCNKLIRRRSRNILAGSTLGCDTLYLLFNFGRVLAVI